MPRAYRNLVLGFEFAASVLQYNIAKFRYIRNFNSDKTEMAAVARIALRRLIDFYRPKNEELYQMIGRSLGWPTSMTEWENVNGGAATLKK